MVAYIKNSWDSSQKYIIAHPVSAIITSIALKMLGFLLTTYTLIGGYTIIGASLLWDFAIYRNFDEFKKNPINDLFMKILSLFNFGIVMQRGFSKNIFSDLLHAFNPWYY